MRKMRSALVTGAAVAAAAIGGGAIANAATGGSSSSSSSAAASPKLPARPAFHGPAPGSAAHEDAEKAVTGAAAARARAAAVKAVGGGTAGAVTTDFSGHGYETTVTKSDGTKVEVHLDSAFQARPRPGDHGGPGGPGGPGGYGAPGGYGGPGGPSGYGG